MSGSPTAYERRAPAPAAVEAALAPSRHGVFWLEDAPGATYPALRGTTAADLAVIGGGYCGLWTAVLAKRRNPGARVVLLEANTIGWAASGRNGGFCEASLTHGEENGRSRWAEEYDELERLGAANLDAFEADVHDLGLDCQFERTGQLAVAVEEHQVEWLRGSSDFLDQDAVRREIDSPLFLAGEWSREDCALVHPARLARELARVGLAGRGDPRGDARDRARRAEPRPGRRPHHDRVGHRRPGGAGDQRLPVVAAAHPDADRAGLRLR